MEQYEVTRRYEEEDEIDLVDLLKTIIRERKLVMIITMLMTILALGLAVYKKSSPKKYTAVIRLNNQIGNIPLYDDELKSEIIKYVQSTGLLSSELKKKDNKESKYNEYNDLKLLVDQKDKKDKFEFKDLTKEKEIENVEIELMNKLNTLNVEVNNIFKEKLNKEIEEIDEKLEILKKETENLDKSINEIILKNNIVLDKEVSEIIMYLDPILYTEFTKNNEQLKKYYNQSETLNSFNNKIKNKDVFLLLVENIEFTSSKLSGIVLIILGMIFGLGFGMFVAIIKNPVKEILKEIKEENK